MIIAALEAHRPKVKALWLEAFGGDELYAHMFLHRHAEEKNTLLYLHGDTLCAMLFILPCRVVFGSDTYRCAYLYGVATAGAYRGRGLSTALLDAAYKLCGERGYDLCALAPANKGLFGFYEKRGYAVQGCVKNLTITTGQALAEGSIPFFSPIRAEGLVALRREAFGAAYLEWDSLALNYIITENEFSGGRFYSYRLGDESGFLSCTPNKEQLLIKEFSGNTQRLPQIADGLRELYHKESYLFRLAATAPLGEMVPLVMTRWITHGTTELFYPSHLLE